MKITGNHQNLKTHRQRTRKRLRKKVAVEVTQCRLLTQMIVAGIRRRKSTEVAHGHVHVQDEATQGLEEVDRDHAQDDVTRRRRDKEVVREVLTEKAASLTPVMDQRVNIVK